ncbi:Auxin-responsive protein SAUR19 [Capsicum annuum]|uniref:Auxin-responsive protein SAUR19 n=1 Tax=Capsicum annuum TaxID=4072 RepID=A0A2G2Y5N5_CAPAN|nr:Auxin-responsive protein SAUR19 [Capsicum annuum]
MQNTNLICCVILKIQQSFFQVIQLKLQNYLTKGIKMTPLIQGTRILRRFSTFGGVPEGHCAVYVGESQKKRFIVPVSYLSQHLFPD